MFKKPFFGLCKPRLSYATTGDFEKESIKEIPLPEKVTLLIEKPLSNSNDFTLKSGDKIKTGQKIRITEESQEYVISTVTGSIDSISDYTGYLGRKYFSISINSETEDLIDEEFAEAVKSDSHQDTLGFIRSLPGNPDFGSVIDPETSINTIIINGFDKDLLVNTNQTIIKTRAEDIRKGIGFLKEITKCKKIIMPVPPELKFSAEKCGAEVKVINVSYPEAFPAMIMKNLLGKIVPAGKSCLEMGVAFLNPETVASLATAFDQKKIPATKTFTVIDKNNKTLLATARIGTPIKEIIKDLNIVVNTGDRIVQGGPMTGISLFSEEMPVLGDMDSLMIQDKSQIISNSDNPCVNCGECIRVCPSKIQVNMLIRLLENAHYEEAADDYDLLSCIECGLCAFVCEARIPLFHYIMLGKYEFGKLKSVEEDNE